MWYWLVFRYTQTWKRLNPFHCTNLGEEKETAAEQISYQATLVQRLRSAVNELVAAHSSNNTREVRNSNICSIFRRAASCCKSVKQMDLSRFCGTLHKYQFAKSGNVYDTSKFVQLLTCFQTAMSLTQCADARTCLYWYCVSPGH
jgi:hypothetical protein